MNANTRAQHQTTLRRFLRVAVDLPARLERQVSKSRALDPYSVWEVSQLVAALMGAPDAIRATGSSALVLGIGHGIVIPKTELVISAAGGALSWSEKFLDIDPALSRFLQDTVISGFSTREWDQARAWLAENRPSEPDLRVNRLRDTWLCGPMQDPGVSKSARELMNDFGVGRRFIESLTEMPCLVSPEDAGFLLRNF